MFEELILQQRIVCLGVSLLLPLLLQLRRRPTWIDSRSILPAVHGGVGHWSLSVMLVVCLLVNILVVVDRCSGVLSHVRLSDLRRCILVDGLLDEEAIAEVYHVAEIVLIPFLVELVGAGVQIAHLGVGPQFVQVLHTLVAGRIVDIDHLRAAMGNLPLTVL